MNNTNTADGSWLEDINQYSTTTNVDFSNISIDFNTTMEYKLDTVFSFLSSPEYQYIDVMDAFGIYPIEKAVIKRDDWARGRLWMVDWRNGMLGDDIIPGECIMCNSVFWGDDLVPIQEIFCNKVASGYTTKLSEIRIQALRDNRICKKCFRVHRISTNLQKPSSSTGYASYITTLNKDVTYTTTTNADTSISAGLYGREAKLNSK